MTESTQIPWGGLLSELKTPAVGWSSGVVLSGCKDCGKEETMTRSLSSCLLFETQLRPRWLELHPWLFHGLKNQRRWKVDGGLINSCNRTKGPGATLMQGSSSVRGERKVNRTKKWILPWTLHKSTIIPSVLDLCPVRDSCNWGWAIATLLRGLCVHTVVHTQNWKKQIIMRSTHLWLVAIGVQHHCPFRTVVAVAKAKLLHEDFVLAVLPTLND